LTAGVLVGVGMGPEYSSEWAWGHSSPAARHLSGRRTRLAGSPTRAALLRHSCPPVHAAPPLRTPQILCRLTPCAPARHAAC